jgi:L-rhamnose isomerase
MQLINIGFGNMVSSARVIAIVSPESAPIKRIIQEAKDKGTLIDATYGRRTRAVLIMDSDHVVLFDDETREMMKEIVRADALGRVFLATDYFDASINRISAWVTGLHSVQKALLYALLEPKTLKALQDANNFTELMVRQEELKTMPFGAVWEEYLRRETVPQDYFAEIKRYEADVLSKR